MIDWAAQREWFASDGALRDIYVLGTDVRDWEQCIAMVCGSYSTRAWRGDVRTEVPERFVGVFDGDHRLRLEVLVERVQLNCHFFHAGEVEFDFDPRQVSGESELRSLLDLMRRLASATSKRVLMTMENMQDEWLFECVDHEVRAHRP